MAGDSTKAASSVDASPVTCSAAEVATVPALVVSEDIGYLAFVGGRDVGDQIASQLGLARTEKGVPMSAFDLDDVPNWRGRDVIDQDGHAIGVITDIYVDDLTGRPEWATVKSGLFSGRVTFVPLSQATLHGLRVQVPYNRSHIHEAPNIDADGHLSADEEAGLYRHYGLDYTPVGTGGPAGPHGADSEFIAPATDRVDERTAADARKGGRLRLRRHRPADQGPDRTPGE